MSYSPRSVCHTLLGEFDIQSQQGQGKILLGKLHKKNDILPTKALVILYFLSPWDIPGLHPLDVPWPWGQETHTLPLLVGGIYHNPTRRECS